VSDDKYAQEISPALLALLVCPVDHGPLDYASAKLTCTICGKVYPVEDGIPNMLAEPDL